MFITHGASGLRNFWHLKSIGMCLRGSRKIWNNEEILVNSLSSSSDISEAVSNINFWHLSAKILYTVEPKTATSPCVHFEALRDCGDNRSKYLFPANIGPGPCVTPFTFIFINSKIHGLIPL